MSGTFLPFARPCLNDEAIAEVVECLKSGWLSTGPRVAKFEDMLSRYHGGRRALCLSSATAGLHLTLLALELKEGDEVITTPFTFVATLNAIVLAGGRPVLIDIDPATLNMDLSKLEAAITPRTRALLPVHFAGLPCDLDAIYALAKKHRLRVVEDCAHAIGATYKDRKIGAFGDVQVMSFHPNKNITTGEGGAVITDDAEIISKVERLRFHGIDRNAFDRFAKSGSHRYDVVSPGFKYNMMDIQAALGLHQLPALDGFIERRSALAARYMKKLSGRPGLLLPIHAPGHAWHLFTLQLATADRDAFVQAMKEDNVGIGVHYESAHCFRWYKERYGWKPEDFPQALQAGRRIVSLPLFPDMSEAEQDRVIKSLEKNLRKG